MTMMTCESCGAVTCKECTSSYAEKWGKRPWRTVLRCGHPGPRKGHVVCTERPSLAQVALYEFPRGGSTVKGPSIDLALAIAQAWGNIDSGFIELERRKGESSVMAYAWDLETNTRESRVFSVPHIRESNKGNYALTDPRDIYEAVANQAARRVRACILSIVPSDVVEEAQNECEKTLRRGSKKPIEERRAEMAAKFEEGYGVTVDALEGYIGKRSAGWLFLFQSHHDTWYDPPVVWESWPEVKEWLHRNTVDSTNYVIINEYDKVISYDDFVDMVEERQEDEFCKSNPDNFKNSRNVDGYRFTDGYFS